MLSVARSEIGSNRQNRGNRFLTVIQYSLDMSLALREVARVTRPGSLSIVVIGRESMVCGVRFFNGELIAELAARAIGLTLERRQERVFRNRYGKPIYEDILHLRSTGDVPEHERTLVTAQRIATELLSAGRHSVDDTTTRMIEDALARAPLVCPSPTLGRQPPLTSDCDDAFVVPSWGQASCPAREFLNCLLPTGRASALPQEFPFP